MDELPVHELSAVNNISLRLKYGATPGIPLVTNVILETVTCSPDRPTLEVLSNYRDASSGIKENSVAGRDHRAKAHFAVGDALVSFGDLVERVGLGHYFDFARCGDL
jgi:hypothetical protein